jgi:hypothetical protein
MSNTNNTIEILTRGIQGVRGVTGPIGLVGPTGVQGVTGIPGPTGAQGFIGVTGDKGDEGVAGIPGPTGAQGILGPTGPSGEYPNYVGEYNNGNSYNIGQIVSIPVGSPYGNAGQLFIRIAGPNPGYPPSDTSYWQLYTNGLVVAGLPTYLPLKCFTQSSDYTVNFEYFNYDAYGASIAIARTPQVDAYMNYAVTAGVAQFWTFKSFDSAFSDITVQLGVPSLNVEVASPNKPIWTLSYISTPPFGTNGTEYGVFLSKTGAL